jgi:hypothetical protein
MHNRNLTTKDYANIAFTLPDEFVKICSNMTADQCEAFVDIRNLEGRTYIEALPNTKREATGELLYILRNLSPDKLFAVCQQTNASHQTLFHQIAKSSYAYSAIAVYLLEALTHEQLLELFSKLDKYNKTIFHYQFNGFNFEKMKAIFDLPKFKELLNNMATIQDNEGATYLSRTSEIGSNYLEYFLDILEDETLDKLMTLKDRSGNTFLYYFMRNVKQVETIKKIHAKALAIQTKCKTNNYYLAILALIISSSEINIIGIEKADLVEIGLAILKDMLAESNFPSNELLAFSKDSETPLILVILLNFETIIEPFVRKLSATHQAAKIRIDSKALAKSLFEKVPTHKFLNALEQFRGKRPFLNGTNAVKLHTLNNFFERIDFIPYIESDPLKVFQLLKITTIYLGPKISSRRLGFVEAKHSYQFRRFLFAPELSILETPKKFCDFYQKIFDYQLTRGNKYNPDYLTIVKKAIAAIVSRDKVKYPDTDNRFTQAQIQLESMSTLLKKTLTTEAVMKMRIL